MISSVVERVFGIALYFKLSRQLSLTSLQIAYCYPMATHANLWQFSCLLTRRVSKPHFMSTRSSRKWGMGPTNLNHPNSAQGFILLEVLVAMSLIMGAWMVSIGAYQALALRLTQQESRRSQLRQAFDQFELLEQVRANQNQINPLNNSTKGGKHEPSRVSRRNRTVQSVVKPTVKNER
jgi:hypothetical protein